MSQLTEAPNAAARSSISRAYYAAWLVMREFALARGISFPQHDARGRRVGAHERVIEVLLVVTDPATSKYHGWMYNLKDMRRRADYEMEDILIASQAPRAIEISETVITWLDSLPE